MPPRDTGTPGRAAERGRASRRTVLLGCLGLGLAAAGGAAGGYELIEDGALPGRYALARLDGACGSPLPLPAGRLPVRRELTFYSRYRHRYVAMITLVPAARPTARGLAVVVGLHGAGANAQTMAAQIGPAMTAAGITGFAAVTVDGGNTYWHSRADGDDPVGMIIFEVLPRLAAAGMRTGRIGITGESAGGYGALLLAERLARSPAGSMAGSRASAGSTAGLGPAASPEPRAAAVAALSPAIFASYAAARAANRDAFDSAADFGRNDVLTGLSALRSVPAWVSCGTDDPFGPETALLRTRLAGITGRQLPGGLLPGCHDDAFWSRNLPAALTFVGANLR